jgi:hypothetical protein
MALILTKHARDNVALYNLDPAWIEATIAGPQHADRDPEDSALIRAWRRTRREAAAHCALSIGQ